MKEYMTNYHYLYTDGSHMPEKDIAGIGGYILNENKEQTFIFSESIQDKKLHPKHEILALEFGLTAALKKGIKNLHCFSDDQQLCLISNVKDITLQAHYISNTPLLDRIFKLILQFDYVDFSYIPRKQNKIADKLSREKILSLNLTQNTIDEQTNKFTLPNLYSLSSSVKSNTKQTIYLKSATEYFFTFETIIKNKNIHLIINEVIQDKTTIISKRLLENTCLSPSKWNINYIDKITKTLENITIPKIGLVFIGTEHSQTIDKIIRGKKNIPVKLQGNLYNLNQVSQKFESIIIHNHTNVINSIRQYHKPSKKQDNIHILPKDKKDVLFEAIKILGEDSYNIGDNLMIEKRYSLGVKKQDDISEIQKKYFGEFIKLVIREEQKKLAIKAKETEPAQRNRVEQVRQSLISKGIKLKF